tara:strand:+ start:9019 stop:9984 length:966 start_codon:yes stop_codon:yes gene_type:complete
MKENFVTLFNYNFLPQGKMLIDSIQKFPVIIWVVCLDRKLYEYFLKTNKSKNIKPIFIGNHEDKEMKKAKRNRPFLEYCFYLTPILSEIIFKLDNRIKQVTYVDADIYFFKNPKPIFDEFKKSNKDIFLTLHGFSKESKKLEVNGKFCVQFFIVKKNNFTKYFMQKWRKLCLESTKLDIKNNILGDQKYLDYLYKKNENKIHVGKKKEYFQAPWSDNKFKANNAIIFHFHGLRIKKDSIQLYHSYKINYQKIEFFYKPYLKKLIAFLKIGKLQFKQLFLNDGTNIRIKIIAVIKSYLFYIFTKRRLKKIIRIKKFIETNKI